MTTLKVKLKVNRKGNGKRVSFDLERLTAPVVAEQYEEELAGRFAPLLWLNEDAQSLCDDFTNIMDNVAEEKVEKFRKIKKPRITTEVIKKCDDRREKKKRWNLGAEELVEYRMVDKKARNAINEATSHTMEKQAEEIQVSLNRNDSKVA